MKVPFNDLSHIHDPIKEEILGHLSDLISHSGFVLGPVLEEFEANLAEFVGVPYAAGVASGYDALYASLKALEIGPGDEVIVPAHTFVATAFAVSNCGATPVFVDNLAEDFNINSDQISKAVTKNTKAVIPVHLYGQAVNMDALKAAADAHDLAIIEDNAQSIGAHFKGQACGTFGQAGCISFYPGKALGSMGEGGAILSSDQEFIEKIKALRNVGQYEKGRHEMIGLNTRLQTFQAAILNTKLKHYPQEIEERQKIAKWYNDRLANVNGVEVPHVKPDCDHIYHLYVIQVDNPEHRDYLRGHLNEAGIQSGVHYPVAVPFQPCYKSLGYKPTDFPVAHHITQTIVSLPFYVGMKEEEIAYIGDQIEKFMARMGVSAKAS